MIMRMHKLFIHTRELKFFLAWEKHAVFSLRHVGLTSLQYRIPFDVGNGDNPKALMWLQAPPTPHHTILSCLEFDLGRTLRSHDIASVIKAQYDHMH